MTGAQYNQIAQLRTLKNRYVAVRHGQSESNVLGIMVGDPAKGTAGFGLVAEGRQQVEAGIEGFLAEYGRAQAAWRIIASDFRRTRETAEIIRARLKLADEIALTPKLRERYFGELEGQKTIESKKLFEQERLEPEKNLFGAESLNELITRITSVVRECEEKFSEKGIILVTHRDAIQILKAAFRRADVIMYHEEVRPPPGSFTGLTLGE